MNWFKLYEVNCNYQDKLSVYSYVNVASLIWYSFKLLSIFNHSFQYFLYLDTRLEMVWESNGFTTMVNFKRSSQLLLSDKVMRALSLFLIASAKKWS